MANHAPVVVMTKHYTSGPPAPLCQEDDGGGGVDTLAIEKQEEWIKKRKVEQITTKQIETRVKRQVVVDEDGQVVDDSGPQVTTNTSEDTQTKKEEHTEKKDGDEGTVAVPAGWAVVPGVVIVREKHEKKSNTRDEIDERLETEQVHHLGHITSEELQEALDEQKQTGKALACTLRQSSEGSAPSERQLASAQLPYSSPVKIVHQSRKHKRIVDQKNTEERSEEKDGRVTTETKKHEHHEEVEDEEVPDDAGREPSDTSSVHEITKETRNHYTTVKDEDQVEFIAVPKGGDSSSGIRLGRGPITLRTVEHAGHADIHPVSSTPLGAAPTAQPAAPPSPEPYNPPKAQDPPPEKLVEPAAERTDALTKKPLDLEEEEETRKLETSRWLENHFGSESSSSGSTGGSSRGQRAKKTADKMPSHVSSGGISVTMLSDPVRTRYEAPDGPAPAPPFAKSSRPLRPEQIYGVASPPQSPVFKSMPYQSQTNGKDVKRTGSFNHSNAYSWMNREELKGHSSVSAARQSFLSSMNAPAERPEPVTYSQPIVKRWPPPKQMEDEEMRTSTPVYSQQGGSTIIRLGPSVDYSTPVRKSSAGISRTQSLMTPSRGQMNNNNNNSTSRMNLLNSSLQSVPERENRSGYLVDVERSFRESKVHSTYQKTPPPRPAPPSVSSHYGAPSVNSGPLRASESFRIVRSPQFADDSSSPPVRPIRRKSKRAPKTDSGTQCNPQTIRSEIEQHSYQTLERSKPMKQYYLGEDPFSANKTNKTNGAARKDEETRPAFDQERPARRTEVARSQTLPRRPGRPETAVQASASKNLNASTVNLSDWNNSSNLSNSRVFSDQDRSLNETLPAYAQPKTRIVPVATEPAREAKENKPISNKTPGKLSAASVNRSQSFSVENEKARPAPVHSTPLRSVSIRAANSPLYKSTSFLNRVNERQSTFGALKSPGIVTSISKSQLDLNKSTTDLREAQSNSALYTLPRKPKAPRPAPNPVEIGPVTTGKVQPGISERLAQLSSPKVEEADDAVKEPASPVVSSAPVAPVSQAPPVNQLNQLNQVNQQPPMSPASPSSPTAPVSPFGLGTRGESYSSLHRRRLQQQQKAQQDTVQVSSEAPPASLAVPEAPVQSVTPPPPPLPETTPAFQTSTRATHRSFRAPQRDTIHEESEQPAKEELNELNELAPEARSFKDRIALLESAGIHYANPAQTLPRVVAGKAKVPPPTPPKTRPVDPDADPEAGEKRQKFLEGLLSTAPELFMHIHGDENLKDMKTGREDVRSPRTPSPPTPASGANRVYTSTPALKAGAGAGESAPLTPPPMLVRQSSPFGSQRDLAARRGSSNSSNSVGLVPAVRIPAPVNYSETVRVRSGDDPDSQSDSVQSFSKRVEPLADGFSSETRLSTSQTSVTRSEYTTQRSDGLPDAYRAIRPQQSGGVIIQVRGNGH